ncbi:citryl-CoA lyase [Congregibacter sp.]|uniref:citryl-CoA lyase n=1 Tax=Congregibacter sp. TaxID=2744308 RepID=UPI003F6A7689
MGNQSVTSICGYDADSISVRGKDLVEDLIGKRSFTEAFLIQALGVEPTARQTRIVNAVLVTIMEHGLVPSAVVTRLTHYGAPESYQGAVAAGLLGVGDRYAGTASECGALLEQMVASGEPRSAADAIVADYRGRRAALPGFGHPIHHDVDPRVKRLLSVCEEAGCEGTYIAAMSTLESALNEALGKQLVTNISAAIGAALAEAGVPSGMMRGVILVARCAGLVGHLFEESQRPIADDLWKGAQDPISYEP